MLTLVSLMGEQVMPVLLPILYLDPDQMLLVTTRRTRPVAERLAKLFPNALVSEDVSPYDIPRIHDTLVAMVEKIEIVDGEILFNLTGGTKPMALAGHQLAQERDDEWLYFRSQGAQSLLYRYRSTKRQEHYEVEEVPNLLTLDIFLRAHLGEYAEGTPKYPTEETVLQAFSGEVDECMTSVTHGGALEIDLMLRCGNQVGIAEVKTGKKARGKDGIDQLTTAAEQRYLGTYTRKYLILDREMGSNSRELAEEHHIEVITLPSLQHGVLTQEDRTALLEVVLPSLGFPSD